MHMAVEQRDPLHIIPSMPLDYLPSYSHFLLLQKLEQQAASTSSQCLRFPPIPTFAPPEMLTIAQQSHQENLNRNKLGRSYNPGRPLCMADRQKILELYEKGYKISHIARLIGVTHSCVSKIMKRYRRTGSMVPKSLTARVEGDEVECLSSSNASSVSQSDEWGAEDFVEEQHIKAEKLAMIPLKPVVVPCITITSIANNNSLAYSIERLLAR